MVGRFILGLVLAGAVAAQAASAPDDAPLVLASLEPMARAPQPDADTRCAADGSLCIRLSSYIPDVCGAIETAAGRHRLDPNFFVRLIWKESLFVAAAVCPAGALGIDQFMAGTAKLRGLADPFNPAEALDAAELYLADLSRGYGNLGLAAVAYNGGEGRADRFVAGQGGLPAETRAYVQAITGHSAETWRDTPPAELDLALGGADGFQAACIAQAANRSLREFRTTPVLKPWAVIVASNRDRDGAERQAGRLRNRFGAVLGGEDIAYSHARAPGAPRKLYMAQVGRDTRAAADALCARLRTSGGDCMVLKN
jgi:hypothetical protein